MCVGNTLTDNFQFWESIETPEHVLDWIKCGVSLPLSVDSIPGFHFDNPNLNKKQSDFISGEVEKLLASNSIEFCHTPPKCVSPISCVPKKTGSYRLITDLRNVNKYCHPPAFKYEDITTVIQTVKSNDYLVKIDLKDGFHHVPVKYEYQSCLGFRWNSKYYKWKVLPFGLNASPYIFTKTLRPVIQYLRRQGLRVVLYVDDFLLCSTEGDIVHHKDLLIETLSNLGWKINYAKSSLNPAKNILYIGYVIDTLTSADKPMLWIPQSRLSKLKHDIKRVIARGSTTARALARICGQCVSMTKVIIPAKLLLRNLYRLLKTKLSWQDTLHLDGSSIKDLNWWYTSIHQWNGLVIQSQQVDCQIMTDASSTGWGAVLQGSTVLRAQGFWNSRMSHESSNYRELFTVLMTLKSFKHQVQNKSVQILSDNVTTIAYINHLGGPFKDLDIVMRAIWSEAYNLNVKLSAKHLPGVQNWLADALSRSQSTFEWRLHPNIFKYLDNIWGPHDIDRFASITTTQLPIYNSYHWDPLTSGVDALAQNNWEQLNNYVNPPFSMIPKVLDLLRLQKATATLIAPVWEAQPWFQDLLQMSMTPPIPLPVSSRTVLAVGPKVRAEPLKNYKWTLYAWRVSGKNN